MTGATEVRETVHVPNVYRFGMILLLNYTDYLEKQTAPRNCGFLALVVVEHVVSLFKEQNFSKGDVA